AQGQSSVGLHVDLWLWAEWAACRSARHGLDGAGVGRYRGGVLDARTAVADETCAILAFGGALAALTHARATGVGQKVDCSLLGGQIRLMGWTLTTAMWRDRDPVTGQARIVGTPDRPGISASFNDQHGKPLVFQLNGARHWRSGMTALGFYERLEAAGFGELGVVMSSDDKRVELLRLLDELFATGTREDWVA